MIDYYSAQFTARPHGARDIDMAVKAMERRSRQSYYEFISQMNRHIRGKAEKTQNVFKLLLGIFLPA